MTKKLQIASIWNENSPLVHMIALRYESKGLHQWNNARVASLARALGKTVWVLAAEAGCFRYTFSTKHEIKRLTIDRARILKCWKDNHWPVWLTIHFQRFEDYLKTQQRDEGACLLSVSDGAAAQILAHPPKEASWST